MTGWPNGNLPSSAISREQIMDQTTKQAIAKDYLDLVDGGDFTQHKEIPADIAKGFALRREKTQQLKAELYAKHLSVEQLHALLNFYSSELGAGILDKLSMIEQELAQTLRRRGRA